MTSTKTTPASFVADTNAAADKWQRAISSNNMLRLGFCGYAEFGHRIVSDDEIELLRATWVGMAKTAIREGWAPASAYPYVVAL